MPAEHRYHGVHPAIVVQISESQPAPRDRSRNARGGPFETAIVIQGQQRRLEILQRMVYGFNVIEDVALSDQEVLPAVVIKVFQADAPARASRGQRSKTRFQTATREQA